MKKSVSGLLAVLCLFCATQLIASPMVPIGPMDIEGKIEEVTWSGEKFIKGDRDKEGPIVSGSGGYDRTIPAQYKVTLIDTAVEKDKKALRSYKSGDKIKVFIKHNKDDGTFNKGMRIKIYGLEVSGDEGGTWSNLERYEIMEDEKTSGIGDKIMGSDDIRGMTLKAEELINYQDGSVVSREVVSKDTGTVTVFAFDNGQGLSEHTAPFDAIVYVIDGKAVVNVEGKANEVNKGEMIIMPANKPHSLKAPERFKMMLIMIKK